jgi:hypothetical protein
MTMTTVPIARIAADGIEVALDLGIGHVARLVIDRNGRAIAPFHRAPWADDAVAPEGTRDAPHLARISGDFFCAPFAAADVEPAPAHGWPANATWIPVDERAVPGGGTVARFELDRPVMGARLFKDLTVRDGHPFLYQRHVFRGGSGRIPVANHAMVSLPRGGRLAFSPKRWAETPPTALETDPARGRSVLAYPARSADLTRFPTAVGGTVDLTAYPIADRHEDFAMLVEAPGSTIGWTAVTRPDGEVALFLRNAARLPVTMLWFSNGGRDYPPWSGRHTGVLGVEDGCTYSLHGHAASAADNALSKLGVPTALDLDPDGEVDVRHVIGAAPLPAGFGPVTSVTVADGALVVGDATGRTTRLPFDTTFLIGG